VATTFDRLVEAGAPRIYEPYSYRIEQPYEGILRVILRKDRPRGGAEFVWSTDVDVRYVAPENVLAAVVEGCKRVVSYSETRHVAATFVGEFAPPA
jgi:hypothetical protein